MNGFFVIEDVVLALTDSNDPKQYIQRMKRRDEELAKGRVQIVHTLAVQTSGGKQRMICANTGGVFRIRQSVQLPKAERPPFFRRDDRACRSPASRSEYGLIKIIPPRRFKKCCARRSSGSTVNPSKEGGGKCPTGRYIF